VKIRKALLALIGAAGLLIASAPVASAAATPAIPSAARFAASATSYQNAQLAQALARHPGGVRVSASEATWDHGAVVVRVPVSAQAKVASTAVSSYQGCDYSYVCLYDGYGYTGVMTMCESSYYNGGPYFCDATGCFSGCPGPTKSWLNFTAYRAWLQQYPSHTNPGNEFCMTPRPDNSYPSGSNYNGSSATDLYIWMSNNTAVC
jgi:hypothetical protein